MSAFGIPQPEIALAIGTSHVTLRKYFREELDRATSEANVQVAQNLFQIATSKTHPQAAGSAMFWLKCRAHWRERDRDEKPTDNEVKITGGLPDDA